MEREYDPSEPNGYDATPGVTDSTDPRIEEVQDRWNNGSPPDQPLQPGYGWEWTGWDWVQVLGRGIGYKAPRVDTTQRDRPKEEPPPTGTTGSPSTPTVSAPSLPSLPGVPQTYRSSYTGTPLPSGSVPTLASAIAASKALPAAPAFQPYAEFQSPTQVGLDARNALVNAILNKPQTVDQVTQDRWFEQQKEQQRAMGRQTSQALAQQSAGRGFSAAGGTNTANNLKLEQGFIKSLVEGRRDIALKASDINRKNELAAVEMAEAVNQGDFVRAQAAYQTQLAAKQAYDELRLQAAEFDRGNIALAAQTEMAGRQQQVAESMASFQQYMDQLKFDEMMRQFNEQLGFNYGQFGWQQQVDLASLFPR